MKRLKRIMAVLFTIVLMCTVLTACGGSSSDDPIVGTWTMTGAKVAEQEISLDTYLKTAGTKDVPTMEFKGNNTVSASGIAGESGSGKWEVKDGKYTITDSSSTTLECTLDNNKLNMKYGSVALIFEKK